MLTVLRALSQHLQGMSSLSWHDLPLWICFVAIALTFGLASYHPGPGVPEILLGCTVGNAPRALLSSRTGLMSPWQVSTRTGPTAFEPGSLSASHSVAPGMEPGTFTWSLIL